MVAANHNLAKMFYAMAEYLLMKDVPFKPAAYEKAGRILESLENDLADIYKKGGIKALVEIEGVGQGIALKIEEYIKTGKIREYEKLKKECPVDLAHLTAVEGVGPKTIKILYEKLKVRTVDDLEKAAGKHLIQKLQGFGEKTEKNILRGIDFLKREKGRFLLGSVLPLAREIGNRLENHEDGPRVRIAVAGSLRRMKETIGDIDILVAATPRVVSPPTRGVGGVMDYFVSMPDVEKIYAKGPTKTMVRLALPAGGSLDADLRIVEEKSFGAALQYFTGNKDHNIALRKIAIEKGYKLNEYGLFKIQNSKAYVAGRTEEEIYEKLGLKWIPPELRENRGEIEASLKNKLPDLVDYQDIKGDLQMHSTWSDGFHAIKEMAETAMELGHEYIAVTDHLGNLKVAGAMDEKMVLKQMEEIDEINSKFKVQSSKFRILKGAEVDIQKDGSLEISDEILAKLDIVLASVHSNFKMAESEMTGRICRAMENPHVDIVAHPTGRLIGRREGYEIDFDKILACAKKTGTALEINSFPDRLDLNDVRIKKAVGAGVKLSLGTDSHSKKHLPYIELGIGQARRGWAAKNDIINTLSLQKLLEFFRKPKSQRFF